VRFNESGGVLLFSGVVTERPIVVRWYSTVMVLEIITFTLSRPTDVLLMDDANRNDEHGSYH